jgi:hypothetical protein
MRAEVSALLLELAGAAQFAALYPVLVDGAAAVPPDAEGAAAGADGEAVAVAQQGLFGLEFQVVVAVALFALGEELVG